MRNRKRSFPSFAATVDRDSWYTASVYPARSIAGSTAPSQQVALSHASPPALRTRLDTGGRRHRKDNVPGHPRTGDLIRPYRVHGSSRRSSAVDGEGKEAELVKEARAPQQLAARFNQLQMTKMRCSMLVVTTRRTRLFLFSRRLHLSLWMFLFASSYMHLLPHSFTPP